MKSCKDCYWCRISLSTPHMWKCKLYPKKRFNWAWLHGWFCKDRFITCEKCKYNYDGECFFYCLGTCDEMGKPCYSKKEADLIESEIEE